jgi:ferredoxin-NADP reductase
VRCFICGPPPMVDAMAALVEEAAVAPERIHYEKWW